MAFAGFVSERGPPYRACDLFDEVLSGMATVTRLCVLQLQYDLATIFLISLLCMKLGLSRDCIVWEQLD